MADMMKAFKVLGIEADLKKVMSDTEIKSLAKMNKKTALPILEDALKKAHKTIKREALEKALKDAGLT